MLRKSDGYFLAEMILSLAAFVMAASVILPVALMVISQTVQLREDAAADHVIFDELMYIKITGSESGRGSVWRDGVLFDVAVYKEDISTSREVCVHYAGENQKENEKCAFVE
ncbi:hypothetical protein V7201_02250 [Bacillus sp. JJ1122]|uniref:hypothetical protein n=1 Tax=Bacillus sp. JJ1122 TaxID=3122951 RepID=UPI0030006AE9